MAAIIRLGNAAGAAGMALVLLMGLVLQVVMNELPCPLCNLQRVGFALCGFGFLLNLCFGVRFLHYGFALLGALFGAFAAGRQVLLHIVPGSGAYGSPIFGLHYYSWALILFVAAIAGVAGLMILSGGRAPDGPRFTGVGRGLRVGVHRARHGRQHLCGMRARRVPRQSDSVLAVQPVGPLMPNMAWGASMSFSAWRPMATVSSSPSSAARSCESTTWRPSGAHSFSSRAV